LLKILVTRRLRFLDCVQEMTGILGLFIVLVACCGQTSLVSIRAARVTTPRNLSPGNILPETADIQPILCHSHNDYQRTHPLIDALDNGCISIEADTFQRDDTRDDLRVAHEKRDLKDDKTLKILYVDPITKRLQAVNEGSYHINHTQEEWKGLFSNDTT